MSIILLTTTCYVDVTHHEILPLENIWHQMIAKCVYEHLDSLFRAIFPGEIIDIISNFVFPLRVAIRQINTESTHEKVIQWVSQ